MGRIAVELTDPTGASHGWIAFCTTSGCAVSEAVETEEEARAYIRWWEDGLASGTLNNLTVSGDHAAWERYKVYHPDRPTRWLREEETE